VQRVLIVEDELHLAEGLRFNLEAEGYAAEVVETGEGALELLRATERRFDLVVLDVMLPGKDGFEVVAQLRAERQFVPVLMLTARGRPEDVLKGFAAGADDYLPKPTELAILLARVGGLLRRSGWLRRAHDQYTFAGKTIDVPSTFLGGKKDWGVYQNPGSLDRLEKNLTTKYQGTHLVDGAGHWVQQEQPEALSRLLIDFLKRNT